MRPSIASCLLVAACTPAAVSPPARTLVLDSPHAPSPGGADAQVNVGRTGEIFGPELTAGGGRFRHTLEPGLVLEGDGGVLHVDNAGEGGSRNAYTGRAGLLLPNDDGSAAFALGTGVGYSPVAGSWASADLGGMLSGSNRWVRPVVGGVVGFSAPLEQRQFMVSYGSQSSALLQLPTNVFWQLNAGLEIGPPDRAVIIGMQFLGFHLLSRDRLDSDTYEKNHGFGSIALGTRIAL